MLGCIFTAQLCHNSVCECRVSGRGTLKVSSITICSITSLLSKPANQIKQLSHASLVSRHSACTQKHEQNYKAQNQQQHYVYMPQDVFSHNETSSAINTDKHMHISETYSYTHIPETKEKCTYFNIYLVEDMTFWEGAVILSPQAFLLSAWSNKLQLTNCN